MSPPNSQFRLIARQITDVAQDQHVTEDPVTSWDVYDHDQRRSVRVVLIHGAGDYPDTNELEDETWELLKTTLAGWISDLPKSIVRVNMLSGIDSNPTPTVLSLSTIWGDLAEEAIGCGIGYSPYSLPIDHLYLSKDAYEAPPHIGTFVRSELTELRRYNTGRTRPDLVTYLDQQEGRLRKALFKYYTYDDGFTRDNFWFEVQLNMNLPKHPNILVLDHLVVDEVDQTRVVGCTTSFVPGGDLSRVRSREFKLKWLHQLTQVVDDLHLRFGIAHRNIEPSNLLVDQATDNILLLDFGSACRFASSSHPGGSPGGPVVPYDTGLEEDIRGVVHSVYSVVTRDPAADDRTWEQLEDRDAWVPHDLTSLDRDADAGAYHDALMAWAAARREGPRVDTHEDAPEHFTLRPLVPPPSSGAGRQGSSSASASASLSTHGGTALEWLRPASSKVHPRRRLLATGRYADEAVPAVAVEGAASESESGATATATAMSRQASQSDSAHAAGRAHHGSGARGRGGGRSGGGRWGGRGRGGGPAAAGGKRKRDWREDAEGSGHNHWADRASSGVRDAKRYRGDGGGRGGRNRDGRGGRGRGGRGRGSAAGSTFLDY